MVFCCVINCSNNSSRDCVSFYRIPAILTYGTNEINTLSRLRRVAWINAINRDDFTELKAKYERVCSKHFISGKPSKLEDVSNPDWKPSQFMGYIINETHLKSKLNVKRHHNASKRFKVHSLQEDSSASSTPTKVQKCVKNCTVVKLVNGKPVSVGEYTMPTNFSCHPHKEKTCAPLRAATTNLTTCNSENFVKTKKQAEALKKKHEKASKNGEMFPFNRSWRRNIPYSLNRHIARVATNNKVEVCKSKDDSEKYNLYPKRNVTTMKSPEQLDQMLNGQAVWTDWNNELAEHDYAKEESDDSLVHACTIGDFLEVKIEVDSVDEQLE